MSDEQFMRLAIRRAMEGVEEDQSPFGAVIVRGGQVLAADHNIVWRSTDPTAHAEVHAIRNACRAAGTIDLSGSTLYATCEPCPMCFAAIHWARIDRIVFGAVIADAQGCGFRELTLSNEQMKSLGGSSVQIVGGFLREECVEVFRRFERRPGRRLY